MKFKIFTLGCKVNAYESDALKELFLNKGYQEGINCPNEEIDVVTLNTCSVTSVSDQKSRQHIRKLVKEYPNAVIVVMGCYTQMSSDFVSSIEGVDIIVGTNNRHLIPELVDKYLKNKEQINIVEKKKRDFPFETSLLASFSGNTRAYLKIQDGCNNFCSYCIIPYARGQLRSRPKEDVLNEVSVLVQNGYKEIVLTGIHTGKYGEDFATYHFSDLLKDILDLKPTIERLRISSIEQGEINDDILQLLKEKSQIANHFHIPLQSGSDSVLKRMNRKYLTEEFYEKLCKIRQVKKDVCISTDVIVGFPGETDEEFNETYEFIKKCEFAFLHVFPFSARSGTPAAKMENQVNPQVKKERVHKLLALSAQLQNKYQSKFIGKELEVLFEEFDKKTNTYCGHSSNYIMVHKASDKDITKQMIKVIYEG
ncbi:MAG: tRNA (N(6)-L-threonylcarbamoyladenosine(37)-C(2))-methylthiotransferase MtaB [Bacilli bacterium]